MSTNLLYFEGTNEKLLAHTKISQIKIHFLH